MLVLELGYEIGDSKYEVVNSLFTCREKLAIGDMKNMFLRGDIPIAYWIKKQNSTLYEHTVPLVFLSFVVPDYLPAEGQSPAY